MPMYDYRCPSCGSTKEVLQRNDAPAPVCTRGACPASTSDEATMERLIGAPAFHLKGSGWYDKGRAASGSK